MYVRHSILHFYALPCKSNSLGYKYWHCEVVILICLSLYSSASKSFCLIIYSLFCESTLLYFMVYSRIPSIVVDLTTLNVYKWSPSQPSHRRYPYLLTAPHHLRRRHHDQIDDEDWAIFEVTHRVIFLHRRIRTRVLVPHLRPFHGTVFLDRAAIPPVNRWTRQPRPTLGRLVKLGKKDCYVWRIQISLLPPLQPRQARLPLTPLWLDFQGSWPEIGREVHQEAPEEKRSLPHPILLGTHPIKCPLFVSFHIKTPALSDPL